MYENIDHGVPKIIKEQMQNDHKFNKIFVNESSIMLL